MVKKDEEEEEVPLVKRHPPTMMGGNGRRAPLSICAFSMGGDVEKVTSRGDDDAHTQRHKQRRNSLAQIRHFTVSTGELDGTRRACARRK